MVLPASQGWGEESERLSAQHGACTRYALSKWPWWLDSTHPADGPPPPQAPQKGRVLGTADTLPLDEKPRPREGQVRTLAKKGVESAACFETKARGLKFYIPSIWLQQKVVESLTGARVFFLLSGPSS